MATAPLVVAKKFSAYAAPKLNSLPPMGVEVIVLLTKVVAGDSLKSPAKVLGIPLTNAELKVKPKKAKNGEAVLPTVPVVGPPYTETIVAFSKNEYFKMFNCPIATLVVGGIYRLQGVTLSAWDSEVDGQKIKRYTAEIARIVATSKVHIADCVASCPLEQRRFRSERDFYDADSGLPFDTTNYDLNVALCLELQPYASLPETVDMEWFPGQPDNTLYTRLPLLDMRDLAHFQYLPDKDNHPEVKLNTLAGTSGSNLQFWTVQNINGEKTKVCVYSRFYQESIETLQLSDWVTFGPLLVPHMQGLLVGSISRDKTVNEAFWDKDNFDGAVFMYTQFHPNLREMLISSTKPGPYQFGFKVSPALAQKFIERRQIKPNANQTQIWGNAINLCLYNKQINLATCADKADCFILTNHDLKPRTMTEIMNNETELFNQLVNQENYPKNVEIKMEIFICAKDPTVDMESLLRSGKQSAKQNLFRDTKKVQPAAAAAVVPVV